MPLSPNLKYFLQNMFLSPEQQFKNRQSEQDRATAQSQYADQQKWQQQQFAAQQQQRGTQDEEAWNRILIEAAKNGMYPQQQGGPGLQDSGATQQESPGQVQQPRSTAPTGDLSSIAPMLQMFGMQGAASQSPNQANQVPSGPTSPSSRMGGAGMGGNPIAPTTFSILHGGNPVNFNRPSPDENGTGFDWTPPAELHGMLGSNAIHAGNIKDIAPILDTILKNQSGPKTENKEADLQQTAAQLIAKNKGLPGTFKRIGDLPLEHQEAAWNKHAELGSTEMDKEIKQQRLLKAKDDEEKYSNQKLADSEVLSEMQRDPQAFFSPSLSKDQQARVRKLAQDQGIPVPSRKLDKTEQTAEDSADTVQMSIERMRQIGKQLGPQSFGAMVGRMKTAEGEWGTPIFTDPARAMLEQEYRGHANLISAQEAKLFGGGRLAVQLWQTIKNTSPSQHMDPAILEGAYRSTYNRAQMTKDQNRRSMFGLTTNAFTNKYKEGQYVIDPKTKKPVRIKKINPDGTAEVE